MLQPQANLTKMKSALKQFLKLKPDAFVPDRLPASFRLLS
jgi:hypothetical protein